MERTEQLRLGRVCEDPRHAGLWRGGGPPTRCCCISSECSRAAKVRSAARFDCMQPWWGRGCGRALILAVLRSFACVLLFMYLAAGRHGPLCARSRCSGTRIRGAGRGSRAHSASERARKRAMQSFSADVQAETWKKVRSCFDVAICPARAAKAATGQWSRARFSACEGAEPLSLPRVCSRWLSSSRRQGRLEARRRDDAPGS